MKSVFLAVFLLLYPAVAQVAPPKHESLWHHLFARHRDADLERRFNDLKCALVLIRTPTEFGTGFFVSNDGDIATASHVLGQRTFESEPSGTMKADLQLPLSFTIVNDSGKSTELSSTTVEKNGDAWGADVALVKSGIPTGCWLATAPDETVSPGATVIALGSPGLAWGSLSIYVGIVSARVKPDFIVGFTNTRQPVRPTNEYIRVQMPVSPGLSGAPVIDNDNRVIGILTNAGASTTDIDNLIQLYHLNAFAVPPPVVAPGPQAGQQQVTVNLNAFSVLAQLAETVKNFASPGYGDAVPIRFLRRATQGNQQPASHDH